MRPTFLQFRSPKEKTPDFYDIRVSSNGSALGCLNNKSPTFSRAKRFQQYDDEAKKTGFRIGPGSYKSLSPGRTRGVFMYKALHGLKGDQNECFYVGNILVREPNFHFNRKSEVFTPKKAEMSPATTASDFLSGMIHIKSRKKAISRNWSRIRIKV